MILATTSLGASARSQISSRPDARIVGSTSRSCSPPTGSQRARATSTEQLGACPRVELARGRAGLRVATGIGVRGLLVQKTGLSAGGGQRHVARPPPLSLSGRREAASRVLEPASASAQTRHSDLGRRRLLLREKGAAGQQCSSSSGASASSGLDGLLQRLAKRASRRPRPARPLLVLRRNSVGRRRGRTCSEAKR